MANKEKTLEELKAEAEQAQKAYDDKRKELARKEAEEAERKRLELVAEKDNRKKEVDDAIDNAVKLIKKYIEDYGSFSITDHFNDFSFLFGNNPWKLFL